MKKDYKIAVAGTGARDIIGSTKKTYDNLCAIRRGFVAVYIEKVRRMKI